jgi:hypothetical protein
MTKRKVALYILFSFCWALFLIAGTLAIAYIR